MFGRQSCASGSCSQLALNRQIFTADCGRLRLTPDWLMHAFAPSGTRCFNWEAFSPRGRPTNWRKGEMQDFPSH